MTDRGLPSADGSPACPFVAFEDERDARADRPDHRHRCFAEATPAPRALAHQEAYCLSSAFPVCPTFQDWARREAARAIPGQAGGDASDTGVAAAAGAGLAAAADEVGEADDAADDEADDLWSRPRPEPPPEERPRRNPPRDWAAPPPWASGGGPVGAASGPGSRDEETGFRTGGHEEGQGLAGSAADRLARGDEIGQDWAPRPATRSRSVPADDRETPADPELAGLVSRAARQAEQAEAHVDVRPQPARAGRRPTVSSTRDRGRERDRERERERVAADREQHDGPSWERVRRYEAYPSIKTRAGLSGFAGIPTIAVLFGGVILAALILFLLPGMLGVGGRDDPAGGPSASPSSAVEETPSPSPTPVPEPTAQVYVIKAGDTLSRIAREFDVSLDALLEANKERISNPNRIRVGDEIIIPLPETTEVPAEPSAS